MSAARIPKSLRTASRQPGAKASGAAAQPIRGEVVAAGVLTACLAAAPMNAALAQSAATTNLPPVTVEAAPKRAVSNRAPAQPAPASAPTPDQKTANPYANADAPYKVESSGSGKNTEALANTPRTVTAIPRSVITDTAATSLRDVARQTPGITLGFGEGGNAFGDRIYVRGFDSRNDVFVDGIRDPGNAARETFAVQQIEVMKGPSATIGGRGVTGGAVNLISKQPTDKNFLELSTMVGTDRTVRTTADVNQVLSSNLAVRGNLLFHDAHVAGRDQVEDQRWGGFISAAARISDNVKLTVDYYRYRTDGTPDWGVPLNTTTKLPWTESGVARTNWYGNAARDFIKNSQDAVTARLEVKLSDNVLLASRSRYGVTVVDYIASGPNGVPAGATTINVGNPNRYQETSAIANQTDLTMKFRALGVQHTAVTGVEFGREILGRDGYAGLTATKQSLFNPNPYPGWNGIKTRAWGFDTTVDTAAVYLLDTIKLSEQWFINGGVRVDHFSREQTGAAAANNASRQDTLFNWNAGIVYKPLPIASLYFAYATSSNPVGQELDATGVDYGGLAANVATLDPEQNTGIELGTKWELFERKLMVSAALFRTEKRNAREAGLNGGAPTSTGAVRVQGIELGVQGNITPRWSVFGGFVAMDTEMLESSSARFVGRRLANIPLTQFSMLSKYRLTEQLTVGGQATYSAEVFGGVMPVSDAGFRIPEHWRLDLLSEYKFNKNLTAQFNVMNLTNEVYYDALYRSNAPFVFVAPGRAAYLTLTYKY